MHRWGSAVCRPGASQLNALPIHILHAQVRAELTAAAVTTTTEVATRFRPTAAPAGIGAPASHHSIADNHVFIFNLPLAIS
jgi:hypothetical protein